MKTYTVYYWIKANRKETMHSIEVQAANAKEARQECKRLVYERTGRNAFRPQIKPIAPFTEGATWKEACDKVVLIMGQDHCWWVHDDGTCHYWESAIHYSQYDEEWLDHQIRLGNLSKLFIYHETDPDFDV